MPSTLTARYEPLQSERIILPNKEFYGFFEDVKVMRVKGEI